MKRLGVLVAGAALVASLPACARQDPCLTLPPPSAAELAAAATGADIEREVGSDECDLENGQWVWDRDSESESGGYYYGTSDSNHRSTYKAATPKVNVPQSKAAPLPKANPVKPAAPAPKAPTPKSGK